MNLILTGNLSRQQGRFVKGCYGTPAIRNPIIMFGGAAGGGKSRTLAHFGIDFACRNYDAGFKNVPQLLTSLWLNTLKKRFGPHFAQYNDLGRIKGEGLYGPGFYFHNPDLGYIMFGHLQNPMQYRGFNSANNLVDEFTELPPTLDGVNILSLLQIPIRHSDCLSNPLGLASNWDGPGYFNARTLFFDKETDRHRDLIKSLDKSGEGNLESRLKYIPCTLDDNPNEAVRVAYIQMLAGLPDHLRQSRRFGLPEHPSGAMFRHIPASICNVRKLFPSGIPRQFTRFFAVDWGGRSPYSAGFFAVDWVGLRVFVSKVNYQSGLLDHEQAEDILSKISADERYELGVGDPAMFHSGAQNSGTGLRGNVPADTYNQIFEEDRGGFNGQKRIVRGLIPGNNARITGFRWVQHMMGPKTAGWQLFIDEGCRPLLDEMEAAVYDTRPQFLGSEELDGACSDHALDMLRYGCMYVRSESERMAIRAEEVAQVPIIEVPTQQPIVQIRRPASF